MRDALSRIRKPMKKMIKSDWFRRFLAGLIVGIGWILPGVSGGVIAVSLGIYSKMIDAVGSFLQAKKKNFLYLLPIGIGGCIGLFLVSNVLQWLMAEWYNDVVYFFIGLVIGGIPTLLREANSPKALKTIPHLLCYWTFDYCAPVCFRSHRCHKCRFFTATPAMARNPFWCNTINWDYHPWNQHIFHSAHIGII